MPETLFDVVVIGAGPTGENVADRAVKGGVTAAIAASAVLARRTKFTQSWRDASQVEWLKKAKVTLLRGHARLAGERVVEVRTGDVRTGKGDVTRLTARQAVVICTGTNPLLPPIPGLADAAPWTNREATRTDRIPARLVVLGGGPVACELGQAFRTLGTKEVTLLDRGER